MRLTSLLVVTIFVCIFFGLNAMWNVHLVSVGRQAIMRNDGKSLDDAVGGRTSVATSLLQTAFTEQSVETFRQLLDLGAEVTHAKLSTKHGSYPLLLAIVEYEDSSWTEAAVKPGAQVNAKFGWNQTTPLQAAICARRPDNAKLLIENGADLHHRDKGGSLLRFAIDYGEYETARAILDNGGESDVNEPGPKTATVVYAMQLRFIDGIGLGEKEPGSRAAIAVEQLFEWFNARNLDWRNAVYDEKSQQWMIPKLKG